MTAVERKSLRPKLAASRISKGAGKLPFKLRNATRTGLPSCPIPDIDVKRRYRLPRHSGSVDRGEQLDPQRTTA
jgi:hypothetical protein